MQNIRRWYVYFISAIAGQTLVWALIFLAQELTVGYFDMYDLAQYIALIAVSLGLYLAHWLWAQRLAAGDAEERQSYPRGLFLYVMQIGFLLPLLNQVYVFLSAWLHFALGATWRRGAVSLTGSHFTELWLDALLAIVALTAGLAYHYWLQRSDQRAQGESLAVAITGQIYRYSLAAIGLVSMSVAGIGQISLRLENGLSLGMGEPLSLFVTNLALLLVSMPLWAFFWRQVQVRFTQPGPQQALERASVVRKIYLYLAVFVSILSLLIGATQILSALIEYLLEGSTYLDDLYDMAGLALIAGLIWVYHAAVLRRESAQTEEAAGQALVRRIYLYLMASVGLTFTLVGISGSLGALLSALIGGSFDWVKRDLIEYPPLWIAGLPLWLVHWRQIERAVAAPGPQAQEERRAFVRSLYLYAFIFAATIALLYSAVEMISQTIVLIFDRYNALDRITTIAQGLAFTLIAVLVWAYHGRVLRQDRAYLEQSAQNLLRSLQVLLFDSGDGLAERLAQAVAQKLPAVQVRVTGLTHPLPEDLGAVDVIIGPDCLPPAAAALPARRLLLPLPHPNADWLGADPWDEAQVTQELLAALRQIATGQPVTPVRRLNIAAIIGLVAIALTVVCALAVGLLFFLEL